MWHMWNIYILLNKLKKVFICILVYHWKNKLTLENVCENIEGVKMLIRSFLKRN